MFGLVQFIEFDVDGEYEFAGHHDTPFSEQVATHDEEGDDGLFRLECAEYDVEPQVEDAQCVEDEVKFGDAVRLRTHPEASEDGGYVRSQWERNQEELQVDEG